MSLAMWFALGGDASLVVGVVTVRVVTRSYHFIVWTWHAEFAYQASQHLTPSVMQFLEAIMSGDA